MGLSAGVILYSSDARQRIKLYELHRTLYQGFCKI